MGKAIVLDNCDFSQLNLGRVNFIRPKPIQGITIVGESTYTDDFQLSAILTPSDTTQIGVVWEIIEGGEYASIDGFGFVRINSGTDNQSIIVKASSSVNPSIFAEKTIIVSKLNYIINMGQDRTGQAVEKAGFALSNYIPVYGAGTIEWTLYSKSTDATYFLCVFDENKIMLDYWGGTAEPSRTLSNSKAATAYIRIPFKMAYGCIVTYNGEEIFNVPPII